MKRVKKLSAVALGLALHTLCSSASRADVNVESAVPARTEPRVDAIGRALQFTVTIDGSGVYGAGILAAPRAGLVLTNYHVVEHMDAPQVHFADGTSVPGEVVEFNRALDI